MEIINDKRAVIDKEDVFNFIWKELCRHHGYPVLHFDGSTHKEFIKLKRRFNYFWDRQGELIPLDANVLEDEA